MKMKKSSLTLPLLIACTPVIFAGSCGIDQEVNPVDENLECWDPPSALTFDLKIEAEVDGANWTSTCAWQPVTIEYITEDYVWRGEVLLECHNAIADVAVTALFPDVSVWDWCNYDPIEIRLAIDLYRFVEGEEVEMLVTDCDVTLEATFQPNDALNEGIIGEGEASACDGLTVGIDAGP